MGSNRFSFTSKRISDLAQKGLYYDTHAKANGLYFEIRTEGGQGSFKIKSRCKNEQVKITLGKFPHLTIEQARLKAAKCQADLANGINPNERKQFDRTKRVTLLDYFQIYLKAKNLKPRTVKGYESSFKLVLTPLASKELAGITYEDVLTCRREYATKRSPAEADRAMRLLKAIFYMAMDDLKDLDGRPLILENPVSKLSKNKHVTRLERKTRKLEDDQIKPFIECMETMTTSKYPFYQVGADLALMLFYHGTRFTEMAVLEWSQVDFKYQRFYLTATKSNRRLWLPMTTESEKVLRRRRKLSKESKLVFPSVKDSSKPIHDIKKPLRHLLEQTGVQITAHDLRRTFLSTGTRLGLSNYVVKQLANHATPANDVTAGYVIQSYENLKEPSQRITNAFLERAGQAIVDEDKLLLEVLGNMSASEKRQLAMKLTNRKQLV